MITDLDTLAILQDRDKYDRFYEHIKGNFLTSEGETISKYISEYYQQDVLKNTLTMDWSKFAAWFFMKHPMMNHEKKGNMKKIFESLDAYVNVDATFTQQILEGLTIKSFATEISKEAMSIADGSSAATITPLRDLVEKAEDELSELDDGEDPHLAGNDFDFLFGAQATASPLLTFSLNGLKQAFGGIRQGNLVVVGAHPDTGKTTFLLDEVAGMLPQIPDDNYIVYFNNEQAMRDMAYRLRSAILRRSIDDIMLNPKQAVDDYKAAGGERVLLFDKSYMSTKFVDERLKRFEGKIGLIIFDQLWKIKGASKSNNDFMQLAHTFAWARDICKKHAPVITVHQADASSYGLKYLGMENLFGSNIAIQGEADAIITIGKMTDGSTLPTVRHFNVPKNKLSKGTDPTCRNNKFDAFIDHDLVRFTDV